MEYEINITDDAWQDLQYFKAYEQRIIVDAIDRCLSRDAETESDHRKKLRPNILAPWELKQVDTVLFTQLRKSKQQKLSLSGIKTIMTCLFVEGKYDYDYS